MVTRDRSKLARRAIQCWAAQTWANRELVIVDDGDEDYRSMLEEFRGERIRYERIPPEEGRVLGGIRSLSLDRAEGDYCMQWDDDEWYHPDRIQVQLSQLEARKLGAIVLASTLMHLDDPVFGNNPYRSALGRGIPGTILHRRTDVRYPNLRKSEDSIFLNDLRKTMPVGIATGEHAHLFIRCFHGANTWDKDHFTGRLRRTPRDKVAYFIAKHLRGDLLTHPAFRLTPTEQEATRQYLAMSRELGLLAH